MKIEKLNDNQIRCILDKSDLDSRQLRLSELAYGSSKAKELFRDMMEQAAMEFGFETGDNIPLMIEAIPVSPECLILVVTKVEDPEELDTRFSRFSSFSDDEDNEDLMEMEEYGFHPTEEIPFGNTGIADIAMEEDTLSFTDDTEEHKENGDEFDIMAPFNKAIAKAREEVIKKKQATEHPKMLSDQIYVFESLDSVIRISDSLSAFYAGDSVLYKDTAEECYYMILLREETDAKLYERACNICSEHGEVIPATYATPAYFKEHFQLICGTHAIETLSELN